VTLNDANEVAKRVLSQPMTLAVVGPKSMKGLRGVHA
jgi:predicted Zn-dependent peptidase